MHQNWESLRHEDDGQEACEDEPGRGDVQVREGGKMGGEGEWEGSGAEERQRVLSDAIYLRANESLRPVTLATSPRPSS